MNSITILTMSYAGDFELCRLLCRTFDDFIAGNVDHLLTVPKADVHLFSTLNTRRRRVVPEDEFTPTWLSRMPSPPEWIRRRLKFARRNFYFSCKGLPVRGWIAQQLMKIKASEQIGSDVVMHVDSDVAFVRPFDPSRLLLDGKAPLLRFPGQADTPTHRPWHDAAAAALNLKQRGYSGSDYISNCVVWRRATAAAMLKRIAQTTGGDPIVYLSRISNFSEYILYGVFCEFVEGIEAAGHFPTDRQICKTMWTHGGNPDAAEDIFRGLGEEVAIGIQSTIPLPIERRYALVKELGQKAAIGPRS